MRGRGGKRIKMKEGRGKTGVKDAERNIGVVREKREGPERNRERITLKPLISYGQTPSLCTGET